MLEFGGGGMRGHGKIIWHHSCSVGFPLMQSPHFIVANCQPSPSPPKPTSFLPQMTPIFSEHWHFMAPKLASACAHLNAALAPPTEEGDHRSLIPEGNVARGSWLVRLCGLNQSTIHHQGCCVERSRMRILAPVCTPHCRLGCGRAPPVWNPWDPHPLKS